MAVLTLAEIKTQLKIELDDSSRNAELERLERAAVDNASMFIGRPIPWNDEAGNEVDVPDSVKHALLIMIAQFDQVRESSVVGVSYAPIPAAENMLHLYRVGMGI